MLVSIFIGGVSFPQAPDLDPSPDLIPVPKHFNLLEGAISFSEYSKIVSDLTPEHQFLANEVQERLLGIIKNKLKVDFIDNPAEFKLPRKLQEFQIDGELQTAFDREGYFLWVDQDGVCLQAPSIRGLFYATRTLFQLVLETEGTFWIRRCEIVDYPTLEIRGVSDENARGQAGSIEGLKRCVEVISDFKMNLLQMNLEDMFRSQSHPKSSDEERGCFSHEEIQELVEYAGQHFVDVCPVQS
ncbi:MAG TPA: glycoside hydrolase family 20 zincin-like fold domain-containing protein, partial [Candidatus Lokiarchaeia archaeon]|nr:glycoside hydrolase family 20 zincin-like fold domain-containing protein [Candidatus Lokiarchaeia archaeon]